MSSRVCAAPPKVRKPKSIIVENTPKEIAIADLGEETERGRHRRWERQTRKDPAGQQKNRVSG